MAPRFFPFRLAPPRQLIGSVQVGKEWVSVVMMHVRSLVLTFMTFDLE